MNPLAELFPQPPECGAAVWPVRASGELERLLANEGETCSLGRDSKLFSAGDEARGIFLVTRGTARASLKDEPGRELTACMAGPGSVLGLPSAMCSKSYQIDVVAVEPLEVAFLTADDFNRIMRARPELCMKAMELMCDELAVLKQTREHMKRCANESCALYCSCHQEAVG